MHVEDGHEGAQVAGRQRVDEQPTHTIPFTLQSSIVLELTSRPRKLRAEQLQHRIHSQFSRPAASAHELEVESCHMVCFCSATFSRQGARVVWVPVNAKARSAVSEPEHDVGHIWEHRRDEFSIRHLDEL